EDAYGWRAGRRLVPAIRCKLGGDGVDGRQVGLLPLGNFADGKRSERGVIAAESSERLPQCPTMTSALRVGIVRPVRSADTGENSLQGVVLRLRDRVELVVVAAGAVDRQALDRGHDGCY